MKYLSVESFIVKFEPGTGTALVGQRVDSFTGALTPSECSSE